MSFQPRKPSKKNFASSGKFFQPSCSASRSLRFLRGGGGGDISSRIEDTGRSCGATANPTPSASVRPRNGPSLFGFLRLCCALFFPKSDRCCLRLCFSTPSARIDNHPKRHELQTLALQEPCFPSQKTREVEKKLSGLQKVILRTISFRCFLALKNSSKKLSGHQKVFFFKHIYIEAETAPICTPSAILLFLKNWISVCLAKLWTLPRHLVCPRYNLYRYDEKITKHLSPQPFLDPITIGDFFCPNILLSTTNERVWLDTFTSSEQGKVVSTVWNMLKHAKTLSHYTKNLCII